jgi:serine/threonine-protein kinase
MTDLDTRTAHVAQPLRSGALIGSRYRLEDVAGAGGMATVWRAYDERLQRPVAIKVISDELSTNPAAVARFVREARTHAGIQHPNLVPVYDYSVTAVQPYLVMEYISGCTLSQRLDHGAFSAAEVHALAVELLSAIACVHSHGVLHRDIKTGNVLLDRDGHARLTDFGLARLEDATQITSTHEVVGTLRFLAPELIEGRPASRQSDLYALGVLLRTISRNAEPEPSLPRLVAWLTERDPDARPSDAHAALTGLRKSAPTNPGGRPGGSKARAKQVRPITGQAPTTRQATIAQEPTRPLEATRPSRISERHDYPSARRRLRSRTAAVSALLVAVAGTMFAVIDAGGDNRAPSNAAAATAAPKQAHLTIDQQLEQLANGVRRAAAKRS